MRILVIAGTGFVGGVVVDVLAREHEVTVFHRGRDCVPGGRVRHIHGDRRTLPGHRAAFKKAAPDIVLDMAPQTGTDAAQTLAAIGGIAERIVGVSSVSVYRAFGRFIGREIGPIDNSPSGEDSPLRSSLWPYRGPTPRHGADPLQWLDDYDKIPAEQALLNSPDIETSIIRMPMIYGPGDPDSRINGYVTAMRRGATTIPLQRRATDWRNARAFVGNAAEAIALVTVQGRAGGVYNFAEPFDFTEREWIRRVGSAVGWAGEIDAVDDGDAAGAPLKDLPSADYTQHLRMDTSRIRDELHYSEHFDLEAGLRLTVAAISG